MSSHHVVREKQEPALLVLGMDKFSPEYLGQLLEWSPTVIATPDTFEILYSEGIKVDWLIANTDDSNLQNDVKIIASSDDYISVALEELIKKGYAAVNIVVNEFQPQIFDTFADKITIAMFCGNEKLSAVRSGYEKWMPVGDIINIKQIPDGFKAKGIEEISTHKYQTIKDGIIRLEFDAPRLLISEML